MPVTVSLLELVSVPGTRPVWPAPLRAFEDKLAADPTDSATWGAAADWCQEDYVNEPALAEAFRWFHKRPEVVLAQRKESWCAGRWEFQRATLPEAVRGAVNYTANADTVTGLVAVLAGAFAKIRSEIF